MKTIRQTFFQMIAYLRKDTMLFFACIMPILLGPFFRLGIPFLESVLTSRLHISAILSPYYAMFDIFLATLSPAMYCIVSAMVVLEEADDKTSLYLFVTPLAKKGYLVARFGIPAACALVVTAVLLPFCKLTALCFSDIVLLIGGGVLQGIIIALLVVTIASNKLEGMAVTKLSTLMIFSVVVPFFIKQNIQYIAFLLPAFWMGKAILENNPIYMLPVYVLSGLWIYFLSRRYLRKMP